MQRVLDGLISEREPLLHEVDPQHHEHRVRGRPFHLDGACGAIRATRASHGTTASISLRSCCLAVRLVDRSKPLVKCNWFMPPSFRVRPRRRDLLQSIPSLSRFGGQKLFHLQQDRQCGLSAILQP